MSIFSKRLFENWITGFRLRGLTPLRSAAGAGQSALRTIEKGSKFGKLQQREARNSWRRPVTTGARVFALVLLMVVFGSLAASTAVAQSSAWSEPVLLSTTSRFSWFPDIVVDFKGRVHVVWDSSPDLEKLESNSVLLNAVLAMHTIGSDGAWTRPNDIWFYPGRADIFRASLAADDTGKLYFASALIGFSSAPSDEAATAHAWATPQPFLAGGSTYGSAMTTDGDGGIHLLWDSLVEVEVPDPNNPRQTIKKLKADMFYRRSADGGRTWSPRVDLSNTDVGEAREQIKVDRRGVIYASWETGWDRQTEEAAPVRAAVFRASFDGGESWSEPTVFDFPDQANTQMAIAPDNRGGVIAVWRSLKRNDAIFYAWSIDEGRTWSSPLPIPSIIARDIADTRFDGYHMATDSAGVIHLVAVGRLFPGAQTAVYHLTWDGSSWSQPELIQASDGFPEWPRIAIGRGNQLHVVWFLRDSYFTEGGNYKVWYSTRTTDAPEQPLAPTPTPSPTPITPTPTVRPTETPVPVLPQGELQANPATLRDEKDDLAQLAVATLPVALLLGLFVLAVKNFRARS